MAEKREIVIRGVGDHGTGIEAHDYVPVEHLHVARALHLSNGYDVEVLNPDTHNPGPGGEDGETHTAHLESYANFLSATGITDVKAHADFLKQQRGNR
jgi:hypothetical protein